MLENQQRLEAAWQSLDKFEAEEDADWLLKAQDVLDDVVLKAQPDPTARHAVRLQALDAWLRLLDLVTRNIDPAFDPDDVPPKRVAPPDLPDPSLGSLRPGADPASIADVRVRAEYEQAIAANRKRIRRYGLQIDLRRMEGEIRQSVHRFISAAYKPSPMDMTEVKGAIDRRVSDEQEKSSLMRLPLLRGAAAKGRDGGTP